MKAYEFYYWGLGGEDFEGYLEYEFSKKELMLVREAIDDGWEAFGDTDDLGKIYDKMLKQIADFGLENWENSYEICQKYGGRGIKHQTAMYRYLENCGVQIPFSDELIEDLEDTEGVL